MIQNTEDYYDDDIEDYDDDIEDYDSEDYE